MKNLSILSVFLLLFTVASAASALPKSQEQFTSHQSVTNLVSQIA